MTITNLELSQKWNIIWDVIHTIQLYEDIYIVHEVTEWRPLLNLSEMSGIQKTKKNNMFTVFNFICCNN